MSLAVMGLGALTSACGDVRNSSGPDASMQVDADPDVPTDPDAPSGPCAQGDDDDGDGVCNAADRCATGDDNLDGDADDVPDACDTCAGFVDSVDLDGDGIAAGCAVCGPDVVRGLDPYVFWRMSFAGGYEARDDGRRGLDGFYIGAGAQVTPVQVPGIYADDDDPGVSFNGALTRIERGFVDFPSTAFSISFWLNVPSNASETSAIAYDAPTQTNEIRVIASPSLLVSIQGLNAPGFPATQVDVGAWRHVVLTWQSVDRMLTVYVGGAQVYAGAVGAADPRPMSAAGYLMLAQEQDELGGGIDPAQDMDGALDELAIFDRVLTAQEVIALFNSTACP